MPKGFRNEPNIDFALAELFGAVKQQIIFFAAETGVSANWVAARVSTLLCPERPGILDPLPPVQHGSTATRRAVEPLALAEHAHSSEAPATVEARRTNNGGRGYWAKMTPEERSAEILRRMIKSKSTNPAVQSLIRNGKKKAKVTSEPVKPKASKQRGRPKGSGAKTASAKELPNQTLYNQRYLAKKRGKTPPPLPGEPHTSQTVNGKLATA